MLIMPFNLADGDAGLIKFAFFVVVLIVWGITASVSAIGKARQEKAKQRRRVSSVRPATIALPPPPPARKPQAIPAIKRAAAIAPPPLVAAKSSAARKRPPVVISGVEPVVVDRPVSTTPTITAAAPASPPIAQPPIARWLGAPTIRAQFVLAEILQRPLALRNKPRL